MRLVNALMENCQGLKLRTSGYDVRASVADSASAGPRTWRNTANGRRSATDGRIAADYATSLQTRKQAFRKTICDLRKLPVMD